MDIVHPLAAFRKSQEPPLSQEELAVLLGVSRVAVSRWEAGTRMPDRELLSTIRLKTGIPAKELRPDLAELMNEAAE